MRETQNRYLEIKELIKKHNIKPGTLSVVMGIPKNKINTLIQNPREYLSIKYYNKFKEAIDIILTMDENEFYQKYVRGELYEEREFNINNIEEVNSIIAKIGISKSGIARALNMTPAYFCNMISTGKKKDISDEVKKEILDTIEKMKKIIAVSN